MQCILIWLSFFFGKLNKYSLGICGSQDPTNIYNIPWGKKIHSIFQVVPCSIGIKDDHITVCQLNLSLLPYIINSYYIYIVQELGLEAIPWVITAWMLVM